jgi:imidazolonepropionase-like amidohydrolase
MVPTNAGTWGSTMAGDSSFAHRSEFARVPRRLQDALAPFALRDSRRPAEEIEQRRRWHQHKLEIVRLMHGVGVQFLAGTDNPGAYTFPGFSLHDELALFVEAGLTPLQALQTATLLPARYLNATDSMGHVAAGKVADLVLLDANPLRDIKNTRRINAVVANGRYFDQAALDRLLSVPAPIPRQPNTR